MVTSYDSGGAGVFLHYRRKRKSIDPEITQVVFQFGYIQMTALRQPRAEFTFVGAKGPAILVINI